MNKKTQNIQKHQETKQTVKIQQKMKMTKKGKTTSQKSNTGRKKNYIPVTGISPGEGQRDTTNKEPEINWAKTTYKNTNKKPKTDIPKEVTDKFPEIENEENGKSYIEKLNKEGKLHITEITEESNSKIGLSPITNKMIKEELNLIKNKGEMDVSKNFNKAMIMATKNAITRFMKVNLKLDQATRNSIRIKEIYPSQSETSNTIYIRCHSSEDIAIITAAAKNLPKNNTDEDPPTIIQHVPKEFFKRYQALEKVLWQIRMTRPKTISTNIRLGRLDYIIRWKSKNNPEPWKMITPMKIPTNVPDPEIEDKYWKNEEEILEEGENLEQDFQDPASGQSYYLPPIIKMTEENNTKENENTTDKQNKNNTKNKQTTN